MNKSTVICVFCTLFIVVSADNQNFKFVYFNRVYASYSNWVLDFKIDLKPLNGQIAKLRSALSNFETSIRDLQVPDSSSASHSTAISLLTNIHTVLDHEVNHLFELHDHLSSMFSDLLAEVTIPTSTRKRRSLLPLGGILSSLFGVADQNTVNHLRQQMQNMKVVQGVMFHALKDGLSVLNLTSRNVASNRKAINSLIQSTNKLTSFVNTIYTLIVKSMNPQINLISTVSQLHSVFHLIHSTFDILYNSVSLIQSQITLAFQRRLASSIITPDQLLKALLEIQGKLPTTLDLPEPVLKSNIRKYYEILRVSLIPDEMAFHLVVTVPLVQKSSIFELYKIVSVPAIVSTDTILEFVNLPPYFAISPDRNVYVALEDSDVIMCIKPGLTYCKFTKPIYSTNYAPSCSSSLFLHVSAMIKQNCQTKLSPMPSTPVVKSLTHQQWLIFSPIDSTLDLVCLDPSLNLLNNIAIRRGISNITLPKGCSGHSTHFTLPFYLQELSNFNVRKVEGSKLNIAKFLYKIQKTGFSYNDSILAPTLPVLTTLPTVHSQNKKLDTIISNLDEVPKIHPLLMNPFSQQVHWFYYLIIGCVILLVLGLIVFALYKFSFMVKRFRRTQSRGEGTMRIRAEDAYAVVQKPRNPVPSPRVLPPALPVPHLQSLLEEPPQQRSETYVRTVEILN